MRPNALACTSPLKLMTLIKSVPQRRRRRERAVEREQAREQRAEPQDRRPGAGEEREVGAERERHHGDHDEEEQHAHQRSAAHPYSKAHVAPEQGRERSHHAALNRSSCTPSRPSGAWVAARISPPPAKWRGIKAIRRR